MKHEKSCGTIIIDQDKVLVIGAKDDEGKLFWSFPKGHQEADKYFSDYYKDAWSEAKKRKM